ncbi:MAG TPA: sugar phosphate isomerase/epimerase [Verrucomicrobiae bacterium]|nr:sugar phosphate isomerase/epimerase [Verrucomicrobiae bacterium]
MKIGTTSFGFRYAFLDPAKAPALSEMIQQAHAAGIERLQICENTRPLEVSKREWQEAQRCAADLGMELQLGCKTLSPVAAEQYIHLAQELSFPQLRIVMEDPDHREHATRETVVQLLEATVPKIQSAGMRLAIENHFDISSTLLVEVASPYPADVVGFCVDTANSLRSFEPTSEVLRLLGDRAYCYHLKDYRVVGSMISFSVVGAPLGEGDLDLDGCLKTILARKPVPPLFVETWTPSENNRDKDVALDAEWMRRSAQNLRARLEKYVT